MWYKFYKLKFYYIYKKEKNLNNITIRLLMSITVIGSLVITFHASNFLSYIKIREI